MSPEGKAGRRGCSPATGAHRFPGLRGFARERSIVCTYLPPSGGRCGLPERDAGPTPGVILAAGYDGADEILAHERRRAAGGSARGGDARVRTRGPLWHAGGGDRDPGGNLAAVPLPPVWDEEGALPGRPPPRLRSHKPPSGGSR